MATYQIPFGVDQIPGFRTTQAIERGVERNLLIRTWGGLGDQICAEPTLRYALKAFHNIDVSLASEVPELFTHLKFKNVYDLRIEKPFWNDYFVFDTISHCEHLVWQFISHCVTNCVDFPSMCAFRCQLPIADRQVTLKPPTPSNPYLLELAQHRTKFVVVHAGKHWPSKTFPKEWWDAALREIQKQGLTPILIGKEIEAHQGTVDTITYGCIDLRNKTSLMESVWLTQQIPVMICNDSSPMHMAASGSSWIGFIASCKHPDYIMHWRKGGWAWRMQNLGLGGMWEMTDNCPNKEETTKVDECDPELLRSWLPDPSVVGQFAKEKMNEFV